jgi:hypothetical protein
VALLVVILREGRVGSVCPTHGECAAMRCGMVKDACRRERAHIDRAIDALKYSSC